MAAEAAYDLMLACVPGRAHQQHLLEGERCHLRLSALPTVEEVECEQEADGPNVSSPDAKASECPHQTSAWAALMQSARPLVKREVMNAIEDREPLAIEDGRLAVEDGTQLDDSAKSEDNGVQVEKPSSSMEVQAKVLPPEHNDGVKADEPSKEVKDKMPLAKKRARDVPTTSNDEKQKSSHGADSDVCKRMKAPTTFARRYRPTTPLNAVRFDAIKEAYENKIKGMIWKPSFNEDSFFKYCMVGWKEDGNEATDHEALLKDAQLKAKQWLNDHPALHLSGCKCECHGN